MTLGGQAETVAIDDAGLSVAPMREFFDSAATLPLSFRRARLLDLARGIRRSEASLLSALKKDLGRSAVDAYASEIGFVLNQIRTALRHLRRWSRPRRVHTPLLFQPGSSIVRRDPMGVVLIIGPWNYPLQLCLSPLVAAIAAGNCAVVKPSERAPSTAAVLARCINETMSPEFVRVVEGGPEVSEALLSRKFDHIFFTGSSSVGRRILRGAAASLTPVTLELGGKSPCIVCEDARLDVAARRIALGKFMNCGQTCMAPDFVLVQKSVKKSFLDHVGVALRELYGEDPATSSDYGRLIDARHYRRLARWLPDGVPVYGGVGDEEKRYMPPTLLTGVTWDAPVMQEEIFGPILPVLEFDDVGKMLEALRGRPTPLSLYIFTDDTFIQRLVLDSVPSGSVCVNDTVSQVRTGLLPFGGVGESGMGRYLGHAGYETFTHERSVLVRASRPDPRAVYPPYRMPLWLFRRVYAWLTR